MLPVEVYQRLYEAALAAPDRNLVEVGCAHGAGTVCLAAGLRDSGREGRVYTFEKIVGGTREAYGGSTRTPVLFAPILIILVLRTESS